MDILRPRDENQLSETISDANNNKITFEVAGAGSKRTIGRPVEADQILCTGGMFGITLYEPEELVITAKTGTPVKFIEETLARNGQMLSFEPLDLGPALGLSEAEGTVGGMLATNFCGSRRLLAGSCRDNFLGMTAVNGSGDIIKSGGRVMKNVTGYDLCRGVCGSWGTLAVVTDATFKVLPKAEETATLLIPGLLDELAIEFLCMAMKTPYEVSGAVHLQAPLVSQLSDDDFHSLDMSLTAIRLENFSSSVKYRSKRLREILDSFGSIDVLDNDKSESFWNDIRQLKALQNTSAPFWRITTSPSRSVEIVNAVKAHHPDSVAMYDWSGGLIWLLTPFTADAGASEVHRAVINRGGNATLIRGDLSLRASADVFQPVDSNVAALTRRLKAAFDPNFVLSPGRMYKYS